jgi:hypothetical protein
VLKVKFASLVTGQQARCSPVGSVEPTKMERSLMIVFRVVYVFSRQLAP